jgi:cytochrome P450
MKQFGWLYKLAMLIPEWLVSLIHPLTKDLFELRRSISDKVQTSRTNEEKQAPNQSIFLGLLQGNLPAHELRVERLTDEGLTLIGAGTVTTAHTLAVIFYHVLSNATILKHLRNELASVSADYTWSSLSQLKYLSAVVSEGLRLSFGVSHRLQRISPDVPLQYHEWTIPRGTPVSMTNMFIHQEPSIFPDPLAFRPERWLDDSSNLNSQCPSPREAKRHLVPFSRGTRACLGMNLAYAELFLVLGAVFKPIEIGGIDMELFETDYTDVECVHDYFNPAARSDSLGVRVTVR